MGLTRDEVLAAALELSETDRAEIVDSILDSLPHPPPGLDAEDEGYHAELDRRLSNLDNTITWDQLEQKLRAR